MSQPYIGEIRIFAGTFEPVGWHFCDGRMLSIAEHEVLFMLIGTTYGGDGEETFALPDLRGRVPVHNGNGFVIGQMAGVEQVTLTTSQIPSHSHVMLNSTGTGSASVAKGNLFANSTSKSVYKSGGSPVAMNASVISPVGGSQPHENMQPFLCVHFIISLFGIFPSQT